MTAEPTTAPDGGSPTREKSAIPKNPGRRELGMKATLLFPDREIVEKFYVPLIYTACRTCYSELEPRGDLPSRGRRRGRSGEAAEAHPGRHRVGPRLDDRAHRLHVRDQRRVADPVAPARPPSGGRRVRPAEPALRHVQGRVDDAARLDRGRRRRRPRGATRTQIDGSMGLYGDLVAAGIPAEDARFVFPNATRTNLVMTTNLRALIHMSGLRLCTMAQWEIRRLFQLIRHEIFQVSPFLGSFLAPKCVPLGYCDEMGNRDEHCPIRPHKDNVLGGVGREVEGGQGGRSGAAGPLMAAAAGCRGARRLRARAVRGRRHPPRRLSGRRRAGGARSSTRCRRSAGGRSARPNHIRDRGYRVVMPALVGGVERQAATRSQDDRRRRGLRRAARRRALRLVAVRGTAPAADEPDRGVAARARPRRGRPCRAGRRVGVIGMCFSGGFALATAIDPVVGVAVVSQPALPFAMGPFKRIPGQAARPRACRRPIRSASWPRRERARLLRPRATATRPTRSRRPSASGALARAAGPRA